MKSLLTVFVFIFVFMAVMLGYFVGKAENQAPPNSTLFSCVQADDKWKIVDGNTAGPVSAPLYPTARSCMKQVSDWSTP